MSIGVSDSRNPTLVTRCTRLTATPARTNYPTGKAEVIQTNPFPRYVQSLASYYTLNPISLRLPPSYCLADGRDSTQGGKLCPPGSRPGGSVTKDHRLFCWWWVVKVFWSPILLMNTRGSFIGNFNNRYCDLNNWNPSICFTFTSCQLVVNGISFQLY